MDSQDMLYKDYLPDWLNGLRYAVSSQTLKVMTSYTKTHIIPGLGDITLSQLDVMMIQRFINQLKDDGLANASVRRILSIVRTSLETAVSMQLIAINPAAAIPPPRRRRRELLVWDIEEVQQFLNCASRDMYTYVAFHLALLTGMRQGEILGLRWRDVDFNRSVLFVRQTQSHDGKEFIPGAKTVSGIRSIALDTETIHVLRQHQARLREELSKKSIHFTDDNLVVCTHLGQRITPRSLMRVWYQLLKESGLRRITFHDLRHTHASLLLKNNVHPKIVSERLGHASIQITLDTYSHLLPNMQKDAAAKLANTILGPGPYQGFEVEETGIDTNNGWPNCSWLTSDPDKEP